MKSVLIIENTANSLKVNENATSSPSNKNGRLVMEGIFTEFGVRNRNERVYTPEGFLPHLYEMLERRNWGVIFGEFDHPDVFDISMKYVSHTVENAWYNKEKNRVDGEIRLLTTDWGKQARAIIDDGCPLFVSSRAAGVTESNGNVQLKKLFTYDIVADPGFASAKMSIKSLNESCGFNEDDNTNFRIFESSTDNIGTLNDKFDKLSRTKIFDLTNTEKTNELFNMNKNDLVTKAQIAGYSTYLISEINKIKECINTQVKESKSADADKLEQLISYYENLQENQAQMIQYLDYLADKVSFSISTNEKLETKTDKIVEFSNYLAENIDKNISYSEYLGEQLDKSISYSEYLAESLDVSDKLEKVIEYTNYLAENLDKNIAYAEYIAENLDANIGYSEYLAESLDVSDKLEKVIEFTNYLAENLDSAINYAEYVAECADSAMSYSNMIAEKLNTSGLNGINESIKSAKDFLISERLEATITTTVNENIEEELTTSVEEVEAPTITTPIEEEEEEVVNDNTVETSEEVEVPTTTEEEEVSTNEEEDATIETEENTQNIETFLEGTITSKIDRLIEEAKKREASKEKKPAFYAFLEGKDIEAFESLTDDEQDKAKVAIKESVGFYSRHDVLNIIKQAIEVEKPTNEQLLLNAMPEDIKPVWESLDNNNKKSILAQARYYNLSSNDLVEYFWTTRKFNTPLNEGKSLIESVNPLASTERLSEEQINFYTERFKGIR